MAVQRQLVDISALRLDPHNPRLPEDVERTQPEMLRFIVREIGVDDLLDSFSTSGMIEGDPIIGRAPFTGEDPGHLYVVEGNRRLAALKLLTGEKVRDDEAEVPIPPMSNEVRESLQLVNVETGWEDEKLEAYLGYKHVTSSREWAPEAKARFVVDRCKGDYGIETLRKFARRLGTKVPTLRRWLIAHLTLKQAENDGAFIPTQAHSRRYFGTFYTLLGSDAVQEFLHLDDGISNSPVPRDHLPQLAEFVNWAIGTIDTPPIVNSRQQKQLSAVLASPKALAYFRSKRSLTQALLYTEFNSDEIVGKLQIAAYSIEECLPKLFDVKDQPQVQAAIVDLDKAYLKLKHNSVQT